MLKVIDPDTADTRVATIAGETIDAAATATPPPRGLPEPAGAPPRLIARPLRAIAALRADPARMAAVRDTWLALWSSRLLVLAAGAGTVLAFGFGPVRGAFNPPGVTRGFGALGDVLAAPVARWDSSWYLVIAHLGYRPELGHITAARTAFFPLYPLGIRALSWLGSPPIVAGVVISLAAFAAGLYGIHRLTTLELGRVGGTAARVRRRRPGWRCW